MRAGALGIVLRVPLESFMTNAGPCIPDADVIIPASSRKQAAVRAPADGKYHPSVPSPRQKTLTRFTIQILTVQSVPPVASFLPSGVHARAVIIPRCPFNVISSCPVSACQIFIVLSSLPEAILVPHGLHATVLTQFMCPVNRGPVLAPVSASQHWMELSLKPG